MGQPIAAHNHRARRHVNHPRAGDPRCRWASTRRFVRTRLPFRPPTPAGRRCGRLGDGASGTSAHTSGNPHDSYSASLPRCTSVVWSTSSTTSGKSSSPTTMAAARQPDMSRMQVHRLVGLHDAPRFAAGVAQQQVHRAVRFDRRAAHSRDPLGQARQQARRPFVIGSGRIADPGGLGGRIPILEPPLEAVDLGARQAKGLAARKRRRLGASGLGCLVASGWRCFGAGHGASVGHPARPANRPFQVRQSRGRFWSWCCGAGGSLNDAGMGVRVFLAWCGSRCRYPLPYPH